MDSYNEVRSKPGSTERSFASMLGIYLGRWRWCNNHVCEELRAQNAKRALALSFSFSLLLWHLKKIFTRIFNRILWPVDDYGIVSRGGAAAFETRLCHDIVIFRYIRSIIKRRSRQLGQQTRLHPRLFHFRPQVHHNRQPGAARRWVCFAFKIISQKQMQNRRYGGIFIRFISRRYVKILGHRRKRLAGRFSRLSIDINKYYVKRSLAIIHW